MSKEHFFHRESQEIADLMDRVAGRGSASRGQVFEDFLEMSVCALSGGQMEEQYLKVVKRYADGEPGKRAVDLIAEMFGRLVDAMEKTRADILGDIFQGAITYGEHGQFFTPDTLCEAMAKMTMTPEDHGKRIFDPACGSGRTLLAAADINPHNEFYGQDLDLRCVRMTAINLALRNLYGYVIWGNSLAMEQRLVYRTGFNGKGVIAEVAPVPVPEPKAEPQAEPPADPPAATKQLTLF